MCGKGFIWNPSDCNCECNKPCNMSEHLDYKNCKCRKKVAYSLVKECDKNNDKNEIIHNKTLPIEYNKSTNKDLNTSSSSDPCKPCCLIYFIFSDKHKNWRCYCLFILTHAQKKVYKLIITNINENHKTSKYKKPSKLFF